MSTRIEWCDETWNPVTGCARVSEGCERCYAQRMANRLKGRFGYDAESPMRATLHPERFAQTHVWARGRRVFVCSMGDLFWDEVPDGWRAAVLMRAMCHPEHTWLFLTKRPERLAQFLGERELDLRMFPQVWLGVSGENEARADERWAVLSRIPAAVRFVSVEPMLGPVSMVGWDRVPDWVIAGPETGPGARPTEDAWFAALDDACAARGIAFFDKRKAGWLRRDWPEGGVMR